MVSGPVSSASRYVRASSIGGAVAIWTQTHETARIVIVDVPAYSVPLLPVEARAFAKTLLQAADGVTS